jgi:hypothetical protein
VTEGLIDLVGIEQWIYSLLEADTTISGLVGTNIYSGGMAPQDATYPCIVFGLITSSDTVGNSAQRILTVSRYLVRAVDQVESQSGNLKTLAQRIDVLLSPPTATGTVESGTHILGSYRESPFNGILEAWNILYRHLGGYYRIYTS